MLAKTYGSAVYGVDARKISIEVNVIQGTKFYISGLADSAVKESEHRVESALKFHGYWMPRQKVVVNLAPADIKKEGSAYDLPIALGVLKSSEQISGDKLGRYLIMGELALDGMIRPIKGALPIAIQARQENFKGFILPIENASEAAIVNDLDVIGVNDLQQAIEFIDGKIEIDPLRIDTRDVFNTESTLYAADFKDVQGQENIKRALEIAASGGHNLITL